MTAPKAEGKTEARHRTAADTDELLYAVQSEQASTLKIPVHRLTMNRVIAALAIVGQRHPDEVTAALQAA